MKKVQVIIAAAWLFCQGWIVSAQDVPQEQVQKELQTYIQSFAGPVTRMEEQYTKLQSLMNEKNVPGMKSQLQELKSTSKSAVSTFNGIKAYQSEPTFRKAALDLAVFMADACDHSLSDLVGLYDKAYPTQEDNDAFSRTYDTFAKELQRLDAQWRAEQQTLFIQFWAKPYGKGLCESLSKAIADAPFAFRHLRANAQGGTVVPCNLPMPGAIDCKVSTLTFSPTLIYTFGEFPTAEKGLDPFGALCLYFRACAPGGCSFNETRPQPGDINEINPAMLVFSPSSDVKCELSLRRGATGFVLKLMIIYDEI